MHCGTSTRSSSNSGAAAIKQFGRKLAGREWNGMPREFSLLSSGISRFSMKLLASDPVPIRPARIWTREKLTYLTNNDGFHGRDGESAVLEGGTDSFILTSCADLAATLTPTPTRSSSDRLRLLCRSNRSPIICTWQTRTQRTSRLWRKESLSRIGRVSLSAKVIAT